MFDPKYEHPLELFSWQHLVALGVIFAIILIVFFCRKIFMKYKLADRIFRYTLVSLLLIFELVPYFKDGARSLFGVICGSYPLCGLILWFSVIAFLSDSERFVKLFYPFAIIGALLSLFVVDMDCTFPHFRAFQFFFTHGCFLIGVLYFVFTQKISRYTFKDLGKSCVFLFGLSIFNIIISNASGNVNDPYFVLTPPKDLMFFKDALGQFGYTFVYILLIFLTMLAIYGITYLCTKHRKNGDVVTTSIKKNKMFDWLSLRSKKQLGLWFIGLYGVGVYFTVLAGVMNSSVLKVFNTIIFFILLASIILYELTSKYKKQYNITSESQIGKGKKEQEKPVEEINESEINNCCEEQELQEKDKTNQEK